MAHHNLYLSLCEVSFSVWDQRGCTGSLRITPVGFEAADGRDENDEPRKQIYCIYVRVTLETGGLNCTTGDVIYPEHFDELAEALSRFRDGLDNGYVLQGVEGCIELQFARRTGYGDVVISGSIPARGRHWEHWLQLDPMLPKRMMKSVVDFEFWVDANRLSDPITEIKLLRRKIREIEREIPS